MMRDSTGFLSTHFSMSRRVLLSLNSHVAVKRPHLSAKSSVVFVERQDRINARLDRSKWAQAFAEHTSEGPSSSTTEAAYLGTPLIYPVLA
jgi:hypothetical protein